MDPMMVGLVFAVVVIAILASVSKSFWYFEVIEQEKINAESLLELTAVQQQVADEQALVDIAKELALAELYQSYPFCLTLQIALANSSAIKPTDKFVITPDGALPNLIFSNGTLPSFNVSP